MRSLYLLAIIYVALIISGCASTQHPPANTITKATIQKHKDPIAVSFLTATPPKYPYHVLGKAKVSKYNVAGVKRQEAIIRDLMRQQAASLGGDAVINIKHDDKSISATVIEFKKVLV